MKPCPQYAPELAAHAGGGKELEPSLRAHLQNCPRCRDACEELRRAARIQTQVANHLPNPQSRRRLDSWFFDQVTGLSRRPAFITAFPLLRAPALAVGIALLLLASLGFLFGWPRSPRESAPFRSFVKNAPIAETRSEADPPAPTWQEFRHELASDGRSCERSYQGMGNLASQYRLKDAYFATD